MKKKLLILLLLTVSYSAFAQNWHVVGNRIRTKWADEINPTSVLPEYPRPQMVRTAWQNLNGLWDYAITDTNQAYTASQGQILVPFAVESSLSGVGKAVSKDEALWYERSFRIPTEWKGKRIILHFGAVDWHAEVMVNNQSVGSHKGGYAPFSFDITPYLKPSGEQTLLVRVRDASDLTWQPRGKQSFQPKGIWYTAVTGIWQTVWIEPIASSHIESYYVVSDIDHARMNIEVDAVGMQKNDKLRVELLEGGIGYSAEKPSNKVLVRTDMTDGKAEINVPDMKTWSPQTPYLYGMRISIIRGKKTIDTVNGYTAMRKISKSTTKNIDGKPYHRMALNNENLFQLGPLDQGWWPDGLYTAPSDEALRFDIEKTKTWGFNMIRKHIKVEPARWFYWCDVLGMLVWQDMPSIGDHSYFRHHNGAGARGEALRQAMTNGWKTDEPTSGTDCDVPQEWKDNFYREWREIIHAVRPFQCVVVWVPFNEGWGQFDTKQVVDFTRSVDPTRLVNEASGGIYHYAGDILDTHHYPSPSMHAYDMNRINVLGEYGGIGYPEKGHLWQQGENWGYNGVKKSHEEVTATYLDFADMLKVFIRTGCSAAVYTQTTDVEAEVNGIMTYDRKVIKMDERKLRAANESIIGSME
ncbi:MAG: glycoside hydrolase family 2 TIM barrel-domain containing protein [Bacteroidales bacterium]|nr:glycoside hydrolase family 2 TIM barrel-domain containing protein [Bacteroidales bacterium]